jgi:hypothetical protein
MSRYFFNVRDGTEYLDRVGTELAGPDAARAEAVRTAGAILKDLGSEFWNSGEWIMRVTDESGAAVCTLRFSAGNDAP